MTKDNEMRKYIAAAQADKISDVVKAEMEAQGYTFDNGLSAARLGTMNGLFKVLANHFTHQEEEVERLRKELKEASKELAESKKTRRKTWKPMTARD